MRQLIKQAIAEAADEPSSLDDIMFHMALANARVSGAFKFEELKRAAANNQTTGLIKWLLSEKPLNRTQRIGLARLLAGDYRSRAGRKPLTNRANREYQEMLREAKAQIPEIATTEGITRDAARKRLANRLKMDPRAGDKTASTIERDLRSDLSKLESRRKRGGAPKKSMLQKIRQKQCHLVQAANSWLYVPNNTRTRSLNSCHLLPTIRARRR